MTYQRGTDLKHCPDGCEHLEVFDKFQPMSDLIQCFAFPTDTCPREQAEKPKKQCVSCGHYSKVSDAGGMCHKYPLCVLRMLWFDSCDDWKERTND